MWWIADWLAGALQAFTSGPFGAVLLLFVLVSPLAVFVHECGHALPALLLSRGAVDMHVGSEGSGVALRAGRFRMTLRSRTSEDHDAAGWVRLHSNVPVGPAVTIVAGGPLFSFLGAIVAGTLAQRYALGSFPSLLFATFWAVSGMHVIFNLVPSERPLSDGALLLMLWRRARHRPPPLEDPNAATSVAPPTPGAKAG